MRVEERPPPSPAPRAPGKGPVEGARTRIRPVLERLGPVVVSGLRGVRLGVMSAVQRVEELLVPALLTFGGAIALAVTRTHGHLVPALLGLTGRVPAAIERGDEALVGSVMSLARAVPAGVSRAEGWLVPAVAGVTRGTFEAVSRGEQVVAGGLEIPWEVVLLPDGRTLVTERPGRVRSLVRGQTAPPEVLDSLAERIAKRSGGHVAVEDIVFRR